MRYKQPLILNYIKKPVPIYEDYSYLYFYPPYAYYKHWKSFKCLWCKHNLYNRRP